MKVIGDKTGDMDLEKCIIFVDKDMKAFLNGIRRIQWGIHMMRICLVKE